MWNATLAWILTEQVLQSQATGFEDKRTLRIILCQRYPTWSCVPSNVRMKTPYQHGQDGNRQALCHIDKIL